MLVAGDGVEVVGFGMEVLVFGCGDKPSVRCGGE